MFLSVRLLSYRLTALRCTFAALFGGIYACISLFLPFSNVLNLLFDILACVVMSFIAIKRRGSTKDVLTYAIVFTAVSILLGGCMTALFSLFNKMGLDKLLGGGTAQDGLSVWLFAFFAAISGVISFFGGKLFRNKSSRKNGKIQINYKDKSIILKAFSDSGNLVREPISSKLCIVADSKELGTLLGYDTVYMIKSGKISCIDPSLSERIRVIPTTTVNGEGVLYAFRADRTRLDMGKGWCDIDAYIIIADINESAGGAKAIIPSELAFCAP